MIYEVTIAQKTYRVELVRSGEQWKCLLDGREFPLDVAAAQDGTLSKGRVWAETKGKGAGAPDGMKIDAAGNLYCCGPGGIHVFARDATSLGVINVPEYTANFCFGDDDLRSLYVTASTSVYRLRVHTPGTAQGPLG